MCPLLDEAEVADERPVDGTVAFFTAGEVHEARAHGGLRVRLLLEEHQSEVVEGDRLHARIDDLARIDFKDYVENLAEHLFNTFLADQSNIDMNVDIEEVSLDLNTAIPCGLIVNELISNSLKHGFPLNRTGEIGIKLSRNGASDYILDIWDDGVGFPQDLDFRRTESLGLQLVDLLVKQLGGSLSLENRSGTRFTVSFPESRS